MGEPRRVQSADAIYLVSNETIEGLPFMEPDHTVNTIIENNLAWAAATRGARLYAYRFHPDGFVMLVGAPLLNLGRFMGDFQGLTAKQINKHIGRTGRFFNGRYRCKRVLDDASLVEQLGRILGAPCRQALDDETFGGVSSWRLHETGEALEGERTDRATLRDIRRAYPEMPLDEALRAATTTYKLDLARLPMWERQTHLDYHRTVRTRVEAQLEWNADLHIVDVDAPHAAQPPTRPPRRRRCITTCEQRRREFLEMLEDKNYRYATAAARLRRGRGTPVFPRGMVPPHKSLAVGAARGPKDRQRVPSRAA